MWCRLRRLFSWSFSPSQIYIAINAVTFWLSDNQRQVLVRVGWKTRSAECGVRSMESAEYGKCGVWKMRSMESAEYGKCGVWKMRSVENAEYGKCGVWKMRSMENAEYGKCGV